ncbi:MAG: hypothetical protein ACR2PM_08630, partial [Hyphomicrobiales bacterium]
MTSGSSSTIAAEPPAAVIAQPIGTPAQTPERLSTLLRAIGASRDDAAFAELFGFFAPRLKGFFLRSG